MPNTYISKYTGNQIDAAIERSGTNESRITELETNLNNYAKTENVPNKVSQLENDSNYTSEDYVKNEIQTELTKLDFSFIEPKEDDIPKVFINGSIPTTKDNVLAELTYISKTTQFHSYITIKCQGTSSMKYPKKNFTIALYEDEDRSIKKKVPFKN
jgi:hypothetical protein